MKLSTYLAASLALGLATAGGPAGATITVYTQGLGTPETISQVPAGFGAGAGQYLVPDIGPFSTNGSPSPVWAIPASPGNATLFASIPDRISGGTFLPAGFSTFGGQYLAVGVDAIYTINGAGTVTTLPASANAFGQTLSIPLVAPGPFGSGTGNVFISLESSTPPGMVATAPGGIVELSATTGQLTSFATNLPGISLPFGMAFAPAGFGSVGGRLLVDDVTGSRIDAVDASGNATPFADIPLAPGQTGLRQLAFAPQGFGTLGGDLLVSVSGSQFGGGQLGALYALNGSGQIVAVLQLGSVASKFDPRGLFFPDNQTLLISDAADPIQSAGPSDFAAVPEPSSALLVAVAAASLAGFRFLRRGRAC